ncbi:Glucosamine-6-phosphate isomerase (Glucosamine-6-phosphate deaminase) (GNPDA) (GlcN6P deaminase) [Sorochytrium milnesiophthora]
MVCLGFTSALAAVAVGIYLAVAGHAAASAPNDFLNPLQVLPYPRNTQVGSATVSLCAPVSLSLQVPPRDAKDFVHKAVRRHLPVWFPLTAAKQREALGHSKTGAASISFVVDSPDTRLAADTDESYTLSIDERASNISVRAYSVFGALRAMETLSQLIHVHDDDNTDEEGADFVDASSTDPPAPKYSRHPCPYSIQNLPLNISDAPAYTHRGLLVDTSRNFMPKDTLFAIMDAMAAAKLNVFHWHAIDSQSFPVQSRKLPQLAAKGAYSKRKTYSTATIQKIMAYGLERGIRVVPEFDMPGHTFGFSHAFPDMIMCGNRQPWGKYCNEPPCGQIDPSSNQTYQVLDTFLKEMAELFSDDYMHLGHDEINAPCWLEDTAMQSRVPLPVGQTQHTVRSLLSHFLTQLSPTLGSLNKSLVAWDETYSQHKLTGSANPFSAIQLWLNSNRTLVDTIASDGRDVIISDYTAYYLDCGLGAWLTNATTPSWCEYTSPQKIYAFDPMRDYDQTWVKDSAPPAKYLATTTAAGQAPKKEDGGNKRGRLLGGEVCMWGEQTDETNVMAKVFPRAWAFAERMWTSDVMPLNDAMSRLAHLREQMRRRKVFAAPLYSEWCHGRPHECAFVQA